MDDFIELIKTKPEIVVTILSGFLLPIVLVWLNNYYNLKSKSKEKELDKKFNADSEIKNQEKAVYASLSKILFDVQQLHVSLSGTCVDKDCINNAVEKFDKSVTKYHEEISNNMLYMSSKIIDEIYRFYSKISDLKITLKEFNDNKEFDMAHVSVYFYSSELAEILIEIQDRILKKRTELQIEFDKTAQEMMTYCCGRKPPKELYEKFMKLIKETKPDISDEQIALMEKRWKEQ
ncbi:hypothetical protein GZ212_13155 [Mangrovimonas sp. CR14]|uniref:hypothetical protein n=1 Tax=Mangrovimonas sp. CR14 TaxID=2706120 RepID=UPI00141FB3B9|nr:hypothetical protein [Mangrovimonas sp. CR14]NIK93105.1 hypothetical protein [Mangrovimonas sp. CR14]